MVGVKVGAGVLVRIGANVGASVKVGTCVKVGIVSTVDREISGAMVASIETEPGCSTAIVGELFGELNK